MSSSPSRSLPAWLSPAILAAAAAYLASHWDALPERWVVHWGAAGNPNGWMGRSWQGVYGLLLLGGLVWGIFEAVAAAVRAEARARPQTEVAVLATLPFIRWLSVGISLMLAYLAIALPLSQPGLPRILEVVALCLVIGIGGGVASTWLAFARARREGTLTLPPGYHGVYYANREDERLFVPKLSGLGFTLNFSHPLAWPVLLMCLAVPLALAALVARLAR